MTDLHRLLADEAHRHQPATAPPFSQLQAEARRRRRTRRSAAVGAAVVAVTAAVAVPVGLHSGSSRSPAVLIPASSAPSAAPSVAPSVAATRAGASAPPALVILDGPRDPLTGIPRSVMPAERRLLPTRPRAGLPGTPEVRSWTLVAVTDGGRRLVILWDVGDGCREPDYVDVEQTPTVVRIAPVAHVVDPGGLPCAASARSAVGTILLQQPLGQRSLLHARLTRAR